MRTVRSSSCPGGGSAPGGVCLLPGGGVSAPGGGIPCMHLGRPLPRGQTDVKT